MIKSRVIYSITLCLSMVLCYFYPNPITSMFGYVLLFLPLISLIYVLIICHYFTYTQEIDQKFITKGEKIQFVVSVYNESRLLYPDLEMLFYGVDSVLTKYFKSKRISIEALNKKTFIYELECKYRGCYEIGIKKVYTTDFLGLFRIPYKVFDPRYITVSPRIIPLSTFPIKAHTLDDSERVISRLGGEGTVLSDSRKYIYGDSVRKINWKLTAKKQELMVKNNDTTSQARAYILLDLSKTQHDLEVSTILEDKMIECVVAVLYYCLKQFITVDLIYHQNQLTRCNQESNSHFEDLYKLLSRIKFDQTIGLDEVLNLSHEINLQMQSIVLVTSKITYTLYDQIYNLTMEGHSIILIYVSPREVTEIEDENTAIILKVLSEIEVKCFEVGINQDISQLVEN